MSTTPFVDHGPRSTTTVAARVRHRSHEPLLHRRSVAIGAVASVGMAVAYTAIVWGASGSAGHLVDQVLTDWYLLALILASFATEVAFFTELRALHRMHRSERAAGAAGSGASAAGMVACCSHHLAELVPLVGATGAAAFLYDKRVAFMVLGLAINAVAVTVAYRRLRSARQMAQSCAA